MLELRAVNEAPLTFSLIYTILFWQRHAFRTPSLTLNITLFQLIIILKLASSGQGVTFPFNQKVKIITSGRIIIMETV